MRYVSDVTNETYDTVEELEAAEKEAKEKDDNRKARAKEVEDAITSAREARKHADELMDKFVSDFGSFHMSVSEPVSIRTFFDDFFDWI